jgi:uncharacterized protein with PIN domain
VVIDSSALLAILLEPESDVLLAALDADPKRLLCSVHLLQSAMLVEARKGPAGGRELDLLLHRAQVQVVNLTEELAERAREAWRAAGAKGITRLDSTTAIVVRTRSRSSWESRCCSRAKTSKEQTCGRSCRITS